MSKILFVLCLAAAALALLAAQANVCTMAVAAMSARPTLAALRRDISQ